MKLNSGREKGAVPITAGRARIVLLVSVLLGLCLPVRPAVSAVSLTGIARALASDNTIYTQVPDVFRGYSSLGLRREAAAYLERKIHLAEISGEAAAPLFEEIVMEQSQWNDPAGLVSICETGIRNGARTPLLLYSYGTGLRLSGRIGDASAIFAQIPKESAYYPYALFAIGQIASEEGRAETAREIFDRVLESSKEQGVENFLAERVTRSQAALLMTLGRTEEAAPIFGSFPPGAENQIAEIGRAVVDNNAWTGDGGVFPETIAGWPVKKQILLSLLLGGLSRDHGQFAAAVAHFQRAEEKIKSSLASSTPSATDTYDPFEPVEFLRRQLERHRSLRYLTASPASPLDPERKRDRTVDLLVELLFIDHSIDRANRSIPRLQTGLEVTYLSSSQVEEIIRTIEQVTLGGVEVDRLVEEIARKIDIFQNLAHPIDRYRLLRRLEESQGNIRKIKRRIHESREKAVAGVEAGGGGGSVPMSRLLGDLGRFLVELDAIREAAGELRAFTDRHFNILRPKKEKDDPAQDPFDGIIRKALAIDRGRFDSLLPAVKALEENARIVSWERKRQEIASLRPVVARQIVDALVGQARFLRARKAPDGQQEAWTSLERAVFYLKGDALSPRDRLESSLQIASFLEEGEERWEPFPGRTAGEKEKGVIASILPMLDAVPSSRELREETAYMRVSLKAMSNEFGVRSAAEEFLREFPSSPFAGRIAVRLGHEFFMEGRLSDARELYRKAAESSEPATEQAARYMLGWFQFQGGDATGAARELSRQLSDPGFRCGDPSPFEQAVLALAVKAWRESPLKGLRSYPPIREGGCGGRLLLLSLGEDEESRGDAGRSSLVYEILAERFAGDNEALTYEKKLAEVLLRAGREDQAFARILRLGEKYGPGSEWADSRTPQEREMAREEMVAMLKSISERKFDEGVRSGESEAMAAAKTGMDRFFAVKEGKGTGEDLDLKLKWAIASLKAGDRETGVAILEELAERRDDPVGEKAAILYAETRIAAYERKEDSAKAAEDSAQLILERFPSEKATGLAYRAAAAFLSAKEYDRVKRMAEQIEKNQATPGAIRDDAHLMYAEAAIFTNDFAAARGKTELVLGNSSEGLKPEVRERARNLFILSSLKEIESRTDKEDWTGAGRMLEELGMRFPEVSEAPQYFLRAFRSYRMGGNGEAASKMGLLFLDKFPHREEALEIAGTVGAYLVEQGEPKKAADLYASVAGRFPKSNEGPDLLFLAARLAGENGDPKEAAKRFSSYRKRYANPRWKSVYATISIGFSAWESGDVKTAIRELEEGIRQVDLGLEKEAPKDLFGLVGKARLVLGEYWAEQFRKLKLVAPLEKNLAIKDRFFRRALALFERAMEESPTEVAVNASQMSGDLYLEFGKSILGAQRPKGLKGEESEAFEEALKERARVFFEKALDWYVGALDRLEAEKGSADLATPIQERIGNAQSLLTEVNVQRGGK